MSALQLDVIIVRPRLVWGRDDSTVTPQLVAMARAGTLALLGGADARTSSCHVDNAAEALILAATRGRPGEVRAHSRAACCDVSCADLRRRATRRFTSPPTGRLRLRRLSTLR